jgi:DinB superfamily
VHPQLRAIVDEFDAAQARLHGLVAIAPVQAWSRRAQPGQWSMAECVAHLNLTAAAYLPLLHAALERGRQIHSPPPRRYRRDLVGWLMWRLAGPPVRYRVRTPAAFMPTTTAPVPELVADFDRWQTAQVACVTAADGLPLERLRIVSPFDARVRYNAYACLTILPRHEHRHLWQAEQVLDRLHRQGTV